ncbi:uncharacterized protein LOC111806868 [Cucurbita pepo subsp. pepo]|uniref:uncharacterized protein LOC111806868 n=1 Tax=Cucurbita pepo subsp. pepo TaxID=3664 RepID=UPI000C9D2C90|nr:uncharacterized protein LOC111806868 [Cucurbita pepo subsp. pepo]
MSLCLQAKALPVCAWRSDGDGIRNRAPPTPNPIPPRDRVIGFGRHKGKMLGALTSSYLKWISKNLRARDTEEWAILADQVLEDPVYQDRIQWEFAHSLMSGGDGRRGTGRDGVVSELLEISDRFGWDWDGGAHDGGWRDVNFELLGTSKGGRIPRRGEPMTQKVSPGGGGGSGGGGGGRRSERRDRLRVKREKSKGVAERSEMKAENNPLPTPKAQPDNPVTGMNRRFPGRETLLNRFTTAKSHLLD